MGQSPDCVESWWRQRLSLPSAFIMEEEISLGLPPLTSLPPGCNSKDINVFIAATAGWFEMSLLRDDAGNKLVELGGDGRGREGWIRCNSASWAPLFSPANLIWPVAKYKKVLAKAFFKSYLFSIQLPSWDSQGEWTWKNWMQVNTYSKSCFFFLMTVIYVTMVLWILNGCQGCLEKALFSEFFWEFKKALVIASLECNGSNYIYSDSVIMLLLSASLQL